MHIVVAFLAAFSLVSPPSAYAATEVNTCGQIYSGSGFLAADLDCSASPSDIRIERSGKLDLGGFTLTGTVRCVGVGPELKGGSCKITGPGTIMDGDVKAALKVSITDVTITGGRVASYGFFRGRAKIRNSTITGSASAGVSTECCRVVVTDSTISGHAGYGIFGGFRGGVSVRGSDISNNGGGGINTPGALISFPVKTRVKNSTITGNDGDGINAWQTVIVRQATISGNSGAGIVKDYSEDSSVARIRKSTITGNYIGVDSSNPMGMTETVVTGNATFGVIGKRFGPVRIVGASDVTGNGTDVDCGIIVACADVSSDSAPAIGAKVVCGTSYQLGSGVPGTNWGVCTLD